MRDREGKVAATKPPAPSGHTITVVIKRTRHENVFLFICHAYKTYRHITAAILQEWT